MKYTNKQRLIFQGIYLCLFLVFFSELLLGSKQLSLTSDEPPHIAHGYLMLKTGDTWALSDHRHPPLLNMLAASPLLLQPEQPDPRQIASWQEDFVLYVRALWPQLGPVERLAYVTRFPNILLSILLLSMVIRWTQEITHPLGAVFAGLLMVVDPTMVAHAQLNTTDIGLTFFACLAIYLVDHTAKKRTLLQLVYSGFALGCAMATKATGLLLAPVVVVIMLWRTTQHYAELKLPTRECLKTITKKWLAQSFIVGVLSVISVLIIYALPRMLSSNFDLLSGLVDHVKLLSLTLSERYRSAFLAGEIRQGGWWWYFPYTFAIKTPIPSILFVLSATIVTLSQPKKMLKWVSLWLFPIIYIFLAVRSHLNIGYRHLLPVFPFFYIAVGGLIKKLVSSPNHISRSIKANRASLTLARVVTALLFVWQAIDLALVFPFPLAYFNAFVGGPSNGYRYLVDSNVDWGQSFLALRKYMQSENIPWTWLSYYTWIDPAAYDITYRPLPPEDESHTIPRRYNPLPGVYTLSATTLQGIMMADPNLYDWFRHRAPTGQPGYGLLVYNIEPENPSPQWVAQCSDPISPLTQTDISAGFGIDTLRMINFACTESWIYPHEGTTSGWYILHGDILNLKDNFIDDFLSYSALSYQQRTPSQLPPFAIFKHTDNARSPTFPANAVFGQDKLILTGYTLPEQNPKPGQSIEIATWWSVSSVPSRPLSLMLHLIHQQTGATLVGDSLGVPVTEWREGDILVQRHIITLPPDIVTGTYDVAAGVYWIDTLDRWEASSQLPNKDNAIIITQLNID